MKAEFFPLSLRIHTNTVTLPLIVRRAPLWLLPITVSISKSPNRIFSLTIGDLLIYIYTFLIKPRPFVFEARFAYFRPFRRGSLYNSLYPSLLSFQT